MVDAQPCPCHKLKICVELPLKLKLKEKEKIIFMLHKFNLLPLLHPEHLSLQQLVERETSLWLVKMSRHTARHPIHMYDPKRHNRSQNSPNMSQQSHKNIYQNQKSILTFEVPLFICNIFKILNSNLAPCSKTLNIGHKNDIIIELCNTIKLEVQISISKDN